MASQLGSRSPAPAAYYRHRADESGRRPSLAGTRWRVPSGVAAGRRRIGWSVGVNSDGGGGSYLDMWRTAVERDRRSIEFQKMAERRDDGGGVVEDLEQKSEEFRRILEVPKEERDRAQRMQVIDRAAAAIAAARSIVKENASSESGSGSEIGSGEGGGDLEDEQRENETRISVPISETSSGATPGPDFWSWTPPPNSEDSSDGIDLKKLQKSPSSMGPMPPVVEKERSVDFLSIPFENKLFSPLLPPLQSLMEVEKLDSNLSQEASTLREDHELDHLFTAHAAEAANALDEVDLLTSERVNLDGSRWWKETGLERRPNGVLCRWTMTRGVSADQVTEWQEKFWEAANELGYKELGSEKSGRDAYGNVWCEHWKESMWQDSGIVHLEKTADKWGKNGKDEEWQEKWREHYDASGKAEKWADKWCSIDPTTQLEAGHAHVWHERWGEKYDGHSGSIKYTDKWAERCEGDGWSKWGDKWDENFDPNAHGVKQGETWWEGKHGERWNRTWGEQHNGSGWIHKYGKSSSGEHWDTHVQEETWYERFPHFGFYHCFDNSVQLREVRKPSEMS
ncbi:uncharacterized protein LOC115750329 [Rhodamnia argentea]|uniref:Uncharacterized protein LOC115750329 n=1 Tax=Rhodamnia argentea TaxID=178133 RepID=A0ABM3HYM5_9MYRT|nr:uncharacterized protein LOC115750329 [Rhodamnia argentea]